MPLFNGVMAWMERVPSTKAKATLGHLPALVWMLEVRLGKRNVYRMPTEGLTAWVKQNV